MAEFSLPVIDYCGYHTHNPDREVIFRPNGTESYLFLLVLAPMTFYFEHAGAKKAAPGACILYSPGERQHYQADGAFFNSYVHFFCPPEVMVRFALKPNTLVYPDNTEELNWLIKKIYAEYISDLSQSSEMISYYLLQLLLLLARGLRGEAPRQPQRADIYPELLALREQMLGNCQHPWNIGELCDILGLGKSQLYKYYTSFFHASPKEELIRARLQKARYLLQSTASSVKEIAYSSGFENINHFNRLFKAQCGCTPGAFRKRHTS